MELYNRVEVHSRGFITRLLADHGLLPHLHLLLLVLVSSHAPDQQVLFGGVTLSVV